MITIHLVEAIIYFLIKILLIILYLSPGSDTARASSRKRKRDETSWKKNIRRRLRETGEEYVNTKGRIREKRSVKNVHCNCMYGCIEKVTEEDRHAIFRQYWSSVQSVQRTFIATNVDQTRKKKGRRKLESRRQHTLHYFLPLKGGKSEVCKKFFLSTLDIGQKVVYNVLKKKEAG